MKSELFTSDKVYKSYFILAMPLVLSLVVSLIYNLADTFFVAQTKNTDLVAGVSLATPLFSVLMAIGNIFAQGGNSLISRFLGQKDIRSVRSISASCFYASILVGVVISVIMLIFRVPILYAIGADQDTFVHASSYYYYLAIGAPALILSFIHSNLLRAEGMSKESMFGTILGAVINIVLDPVFISVLNWGAAGAAIATVIGYLCSDIFFAFVVLKKSKALSIHPKDCTATAGEYVQILSIGTPSAIVNIMQSISVVLINQLLLPLGNDKIAAMGIVLKVNLIVLLVITGLTFGGQPLFGYYYGAEDKQHFSQLFRFTTRFISLVSLTLSVGVYMAAPLLLRFMMDDPGIVSQGTIMLRWQVITMVLVGLILLMTIIFQSMGKALASFLLSISRQGMVFVLVLFIAHHLLGYQGILISQALSDLITAILAFYLYKTVLKKSGHVQ